MAKKSYDDLLTYKIGRKKKDEDEEEKSSQLYGTPKTENPNQPSSVKRKKKTGNPVEAITSAVTGGMDKDERNAAASREKAARAYQDEQNALLEAAKARRLKENEENYKRQQEEEKRFKEAYKQSGDVLLHADEIAKDLSPDSAKEEQRSLRKTSAPKTTAPSPEPAKIGQYADNGNSFITPGGKEITPHKSSDRWFPGMSDPAELLTQSAQPQSAWEQFTNDDESEVGIDYEKSGIGDYMSEQDELLKVAQANDRHKELEKELADIQANEGYIIDPDEAKRVADRKKEIVDELTALDEQTGADPRYYDEASRLAGIGRGWLAEQEAAYSNTLGTIGALAGAQDEAGRAIADSSIAGYVVDPLSEAFAREAAENGQLDSLGILDTNQAIQDWSDEKRAESAAELEKAKAGLDPVDSFLVDAAKGALDLGGDTLLGIITGMPGAGLWAMGARTFGLSAAEQRDKGGSLGKQFLDGLISMGIEIATEKIGGPFEKAYGKTLTGRFVKEAVDRLEDSPVGRALIPRLSNFASETIEEVLSDVLNYAKDKYLGFDPNPELNVSDVIYDGLLGGFLGLVGGEFSGLSASERAKAVSDLARAGVDAAFQAENVEQTQAKQEEGPVDILTEAATPEAKTPTIKQAPGMEVKPETDTGTGNKPMTAQERLQQREANMQAKTAGKLADSAREAAVKNNLSVTDADVKQAVDYILGNADNIGAKAAQLVDFIRENGAKTEAAPAEERAEKKAPEAPKEKEDLPDDDTEPKEALEEVSRWKGPETPIEDTTDAEKEGKEFSPEETAPNPVDALLPETEKKEDLAEAPSEAAESKEGSDHESVPESAQDSKQAGSEELNNNGNSENAGAGITDEYLKGNHPEIYYANELRRLEPGTPEYKAAEKKYRFFADIEAAAAALQPDADFKPTPLSELLQRTDRKYEELMRKQNNAGDRFAPVQMQGTNGTIAPNEQNGGVQNEQKAGQPAEVHADSQEGFGRNKYDLGEEYGGYTRQQRLETNRKIHDYRTQEIVKNGGRVLSDEEVSPTIRDAVQKLRELLPDINITIIYGENNDPAFHWPSSSRQFDGGIFVNAASIESAAADSNVSVSDILNHETGHYWLHTSGLSKGGWLNEFASALPTEEAEWVPDAIRDTAKVFMKYNPGMSMEQALDEVASDIIGNVKRLFRKNPEVLTSIRPVLLDVLSDNLPISLSGYLEESTDTSGTSKDPGANKSWSGSLMAQEAPPENNNGERADDDMTPLNEQSRERDETEREEHKKETKKRFGADNHNRLTKALEKFESLTKKFTERYGEVETDEHGGIVEDENGNSVKSSTPSDFVKRFRAMLEGEETVQSFQEYYESLKPAEGESNGTDANYLYDGPLAETLNQLADAECELIYAEKGGPANAEKATLYGEGPSLDVARENYAKAMEAFARSFETRMGRLQEQFENRTKVNSEVSKNAKGESAGLKNFFERQSKRFWQKQMRIDTFLKSIVGFSGKADATNDLVKRTAESQNTRNNVRNGAREVFREKLASDKKTAKAWKDIESGKTKGNVDIPGLKGKPSMDYELAVLKTLMTNGALDHIARFGAQFRNESDYRNGYNNNGLGETESYQAQNRLTREYLDQLATDNLKARDQKLTGKNIYNEKIQILKNLRNELLNDVNSNPTAKLAYEASIESMRYLADEINGVTLRLYGLAKALQGSNYWPMQVIGRGNNLQFINNNAFMMEDASYLQHRKGGSGALMINPFTETMDSYIDRASRFVGFGELNSDLLMMSKEMGVGHGEHDAEKQSIQSTIKKMAGKSAADYMTRWMETVNGQRKSPSGIGSKLRGNLAKSSLVANPGVAIKQTASFFNAAGVLDMDVLLKSRLLNYAGLRSVKSYNDNALIQAINQKTGILSSRAADSIVEKGEANSSQTLSGKLTKWMPNWLTNWIQKQDYKTVANLALACGEQVKKNNPGIDTNSDAYFDKVAKLLEEVTVKTQPIYDAEFRPEYLRSDSEIERMLAMFRTQQSQNLNQLMQAYGELAAAKREGGDVGKAQRKVNQTVSGFVAAQTMFALLSSAARMLTHKTKDYEDEEGNFKFGKLAKRFGLDFLESAAGVVWFGDVAAKMLIDAGTGIYAKASGNKDAKTSEFYQLSDNTINVINQFIASTIKMAQNPTPKTIKSEIFDLAQATGVPARNLYNLFNSAFMYSEDARHVNPDNYDDVIDMLQNESKMTDTARAKRTTETAIRYMKKGDTDKARSLMATLDFSSKKIVSEVKTALGNAYVNRDIDEKTYKALLKEYTKAEDKDIESTVHDKNLDMKINRLTKFWPDTYQTAVDDIKETVDHLGKDESKSAAVSQIILDAAMSKGGVDAFMEKYTSKDYFAAYNAIGQTAGLKKTIDILTGVDTDKNDDISQKELYSYYLDNPNSENLIGAIWDANGWETSWNSYLASHAAKSDYDKLARDLKGTDFEEVDQILKDISAENTMHIKLAKGDPDIFDAIKELGLSDKDTDTMVARYVSSGNRKNYDALRKAGCSSTKAMKIVTKVDKSGNGSITQDEFWSYYLKHKDEEDYIEAMFNAQGYKIKGKHKTWSYFKSHHK